jgi:hypothetical protein
MELILPILIVGGIIILARQLARDTGHSGASGKRSIKIGHLFNVYYKGRVFVDDKMIYTKGRIGVVSMPRSQFGYATMTRKSGRRSFVNLVNKQGVTVARVKLKTKDAKKVRDFLDSL